MVTTVRGFCGIGIYLPKREINVGGLWRHAFAFGADFIFTIGERYKRQAADTTCASRHVPLFCFVDEADFTAHLPADSSLIGIEIAEGSVPLKRFVHPERCVYILGAEDIGIPKAILDTCESVVEIPADFCLNVATTGAIVLYDRQCKNEQD